MWTDWQRSHPQPKSKRATRKWIKKGAAYHQRITAPSWQTLLAAELAFASAQIGVAVAPIESLADVHAMGAASIVYDRVELYRKNQGWIAIRLAEHVFKQGLAVLS